MKKFITLFLLAALLLPGCKKEGQKQKGQKQIDLSEEYCETLDAEVEKRTVKLGAVVHRLTSNGGRLSVFWCPAANFESKPSPEELVAASLNSDEKLLSRVGVDSMADDRLETTLQNNFLSGAVYYYCGFAEIDPSPENGYPERCYYGEVKSFTAPAIGEP